MSEKIVRHIKRTCKWCGKDFDIGLYEGETVENTDFNCCLPCIMGYSDTNSLVKDLVEIGKNRKDRVMPLT